MADTIDMANDAMLANLDNALARHRLPTFIGIDMAAADCEDCGEEIPAARRQAAPYAVTCIECQGVRELKARGIRS